MFRSFDPDDPVFGPTFVLRRAQDRPYKPASQVASETRDNDSYGLAKTAASTAYAVNGLNQYTSVAGTAHSYDANGNLTSTGAAAYTYDIENRLVKAVAAATTTNLVYDPLGRLFEINQGSSATTTRFLNDGEAMVLEFNSGGIVTNRYVHGSNAAADDPLVWYLGSTLTIKRWLHGDRLGSIAAWTNSSGGSPTINKYDEYGLPAATNSGRFQYTGQAWIAELGLYYYKARFYHPGIGRFVQTDPVGYEDHVNLYAYAANDPVNALDPSGETACTGSRIDSCGGGGLAATYSGTSTISMTGRIEDLIPGESTDSESAEQDEDGVEVACFGPLARLALACREILRSVIMRTLPKPIKPSLPPGITPSRFGQAAGFVQGFPKTRITSDRVQQGIANLKELGVTKDMVSQWRQFYQEVAVRDIGNPSAAWRANLLRQIEKGW